MKALVKITVAMAALTMAAAVIPAGITASAASETTSVSYLRLVNGSFQKEEIRDLWGVENGFDAQHEWYYVSGSAGIGGSVHAIGRHGAAAIGAGKEADFEHIGGECKGTVNITGGTVKLELRDCVFYKAKDTAPIDHGGNASKNGTLNIRTGATVKRDGKAVPEDQRIDACRRVLGDYIFDYTTVEIFN